ncbi:class I adenylate-forming enzyme family protein [Cytobacillus pseudoceanisediminis]|uniref:class I adenylate-forming enzyme family protein n=1 Tax=Cytobacillus pseudoceanisediminis TaxID=3051614 RepID=UPI003C305BB8
MIMKSLYESILKHPNRKAVVVEDKSYTYKKFWDYISSYSLYFKKEINNQKPVGIYMPNSPEYLFTYYGLIKMGCIPMLIDHTFTDEELKRLCIQYGIDTVVSWHEKRITLRRMSLPSEKSYPKFPSEIATCRFTSGTTGVPKCLMFTDDAILNAAKNWGISINISKQDKVLCTALFNNGLAFNTSLLTTFLNGATLYLHNTLTPKTLWDKVSQENITVLVAYPILYEMLTNTSSIPDYHSLRLCISSAAPLHETIKKKFKQNVGVDICDYYASAEVGPATFNDGSDLYSSGKAATGVKIRIATSEGIHYDNTEIGNIQVKTSSMAYGYYNSPTSITDSITPDGFYKSSDRGWIENGHLYVLSRTDDIINVAGKKVDPVEIENVLIKMDGIKDIAVIGCKNKKNTSEYPVAFYVAAYEIDLKNFSLYCEDKLAPYKLPQRYIKIDSIPKNSAGKIFRNKLKKICD